MHRTRLEARRKGRTDGYVDKTIVTGLLERGEKGKGKGKRKSRVTAGVVKSTRAWDLIPPITDNVAPHSEIISDARTGRSATSTFTA